MGRQTVVLAIGAGILASTAPVAAAKRDCTTLPPDLQEHCWREPCSFPLDLDGDQTQDRALLVRERGGGHRRGVVIHLGSTSEADCRRPIVIGAGRALGRLGADLSWATALHVLRRHPDSYPAFGDALWVGRDSPPLNPPWPGTFLVVANRFGPPRVVDLAHPRHRLAGLELLRSYDVGPAARWLLLALQDADEAVRLLAAGVLAQSRVREAIEPLAAWLDPARADVSPFTRAEITRALGLLVRPIPVEELGTGAQDGHLDEHTAAVAMSALELALAAPAPDVRRAAVVALGQLGGERAAALVAAHAEDADAGVRRDVASTLGILPGPVGVAALTKLLAAGDRRVRLNAVRSVDRLRLASATPTLVQLLKDEDGVVRYAAVLALGNLRAVAAVSALLPLAGERQSVRDWTRPSIPSHWLNLDCAAVRSLQQIGDAQAVAQARKLAPHCPGS